MLDPNEPTDYSAAQVAARLQTSEKTLSRWRHQGKGPAWRRLNPSVVSYPIALFEQWFADQINYTVDQPKGTPTAVTRITYPEFNAAVERLTDGVQA